MFDPIVLGLLCLLLIVVALIVICIIAQGRIKIGLLSIERGFAFTFFTLTIGGDAQSYVGNFSVQYLGSYAENRNAHLYAIVQFVVYAIVLFLSRSRVGRAIDSILWLLRDPFLASLMLLTVLSAFWSGTPVETFKSGLLLIALIIYSSTIATCCNLRELVRYLRLFGLWTASASILLNLLIPSVLKNEKGSWQGIAGHPNILGYVMALSTVLWIIDALDRPRNQRWRSMVIASVSLVVMLLTNSGGALVTFIAMAALTALLRILRRLDLRLVWVSMPLLLTVSIPSVLAIVGYRGTLLASLGKDENLTGRGEFWPAIIAAIEQRWAFGYGFNGFWQIWRGVDNPAAHIRTSNFVPTHSHNGFLELALALGLVGVVLLFLSFIRNIIYIGILLHAGRRFAAEISMILLAHIILSNLSETGLWDLGYQVTLYTILSVRLGIEVQQINSPIAPTVNYLLVHAVDKFDEEDRYSTGIIIDEIETE
jgi:exopolysaccharide production protein ExoQ